MTIQIHTECEWLVAVLIFDDIYSYVKFIEVAHFKFFIPWLLGLEQ